MFLRKFIYLFIVLVSQSAFSEEKNFELGVALCLTGGCAEWGTSALKGIQLAADEINLLGGFNDHKIVIKAQDTNEAISGTAAVKAFQNLLSDKDVHYVIGPSWSPAGLALIPILARNKDIIVISPSLAVPDFSRAADNLFKTVPDNAITARHIAKYAISQGLRRCAIFSDQLAAEKYSSAEFSTEFKARGGEVVELIETLPEETDLRTPALKIIQSKPDVVFLANYVQLGLAARRLRELGYKGKFVSILLDQTRLTEGGAALEGTVFSKYTSYSAEFARKFYDKFGEKYGPSADSAYDTVYLLQEAIRKAHSFDVERLKKILPNVEMQGTGSLIKFNKYRTVEKPARLFIVKNAEGIALAEE